MKRVAMVVVVLGLCAWSWAQDKPASQNPPAGQASGQAAGQGAAAPQGKRPPKVNSTEEYNAYKAAIAITDGAEAEKAANDFATKYPASELRVLVYKNAMQRLPLGDKVVEIANKILALDPDDPDALVSIAQVDSEQTKDSDLDKDQRFDSAKKNADRALVTVETDIPTGGFTPEQIAAYKKYIRSSAYFAIGTVAYKQSKWPDAETNLRKAIDESPGPPEVVAVYRLTLALDFQNKIPDAIKTCQQAVDLTKDSPDSAAGKAARQELDRLKNYAPGTSGQATPPKN